MFGLNGARALAGVAVMLAVCHSAAATERASPDDSARFLAGMPPSAESPLVSLTRNPGWQRHAKWFNSAWDTLETRQLSKIRTWSQEHLKQERRALYYMFSGPDFLYANAFFPNASTYLMSGLEPVGAIPEISERTIRGLPRIQSSISSALRLSFFITKRMRENLQGGDLAGTLPILYVFIARAGKTISEVELVSLDQDGILHPADEADGRKVAPGVKIVFSSAGGPPQILYYFRSDVSDYGLKSSGFLKFAETLGMGDGLLKSASYLMHSSNFSGVRNFVLRHAQSVVQDDSGIPVRYFKQEAWTLRPFGRYLGPISIFAGRHQPDLMKLFKTGNPPPLPFGIGYRWQGHDSNLLLAIKKETAPPETAAVPISPPSEVEKVDTPEATEDPVRSPTDLDEAQADRPD
jgi:hypothetical protein